MKLIATQEDDADGNECDECDELNGADGVKPFGLTLQKLISKYFDCEEDEYLKFVEAYLPQHEHIRQTPLQKENVLYQDALKMVAAFCRDHDDLHAHETRAMAKFLHGLRSPCHEFKKWGTKYWKCLTEYLFMELIDMIDEYLNEEMKKSRKSAREL